MGFLPGRMLPKLTLVALAGLAWNADAARDPQATSKPERYHVIIITADALRGDMLSLNGNREVRTPHLDALAAEGVSFTRAYCNITTTTPSVASLLSSLYPLDHRAYSNSARISGEIVTLPEVLKSQGWHTAGIVNLPWLNPEVSSVSQGIDELARCKHIRRAKKTNRWVVSLLSSRRGRKKPLFLWVHYVDNHTPYHAPGKYARMYYLDGKNPRSRKPGSLRKVWPLFPAHHRDNPFFKRWLKGVADADLVVAGYKGSVTWLDRQVGELIGSLKKNGLWEKTLLVFTSDHGESLGEHGLWFVHAGLYQPTVQVPLIVRVPRGPRGQRIDAVVEQVDVMPTVLSRLGLPIPSQVRGRDLWELLKNKSLSGGSALLEHAGGYLTGVATSRYKYIRHLRSQDTYPAYPFRKDREELYDLSADPGESHNLAEEHPELLAEMRHLRKQMSSGKRQFVCEQAAIDRQTEEMLRSLGYAE